MGDSVIPAEPPQWKEVGRLAAELSGGEHHHLTVLTLQARANTNTNGFAGMQTALQVIQSTISSHWDTLMPLPDEDDPDDPYYARVNLLHELSEQPSFLDEVSRIPLISVRGIGEFSARDVAISRAQLEGSEEERERCQEALIRGAFQETESKALADALDQITGAAQCVKSIEADFQRQSNGTGGLSLAGLTDKVNECAEAYRYFAEEFIASAVAESANEATDTGAISASSEEAVQTATPVAVAQGSLTTREAVLNAFSQISHYYRQHEPSSPVMYLSMRGNSLVSKSFFDLLRELAPGYQDDLPALLDVLKNNPMNFLIQDCYQRFLSGDLAAPNAAEGEAVPNSEQGPQSREQVMQLLVEIEQYFVANEPASPIPLLIGEMRNLVNKRFTDLLSEFSRAMPVARKDADASAQNGSEE